MVGFKHTIWALLLMMVTGTAIAQNNTNSPYTRYGYGDLSDQSHIVCKESLYYFERLPFR